MSLRTFRYSIAVALLAAGCSGTSSGSTTASPSTAGPTSGTVSTTTTTAVTATTSPPDAPILVPQITVTGGEEMVFHWAEEACEPEHIPDIAARAFRDARGQVQLIIGHYVNYRMIGPSLDEVATDCTGPVLRSDFDPDPSTFNDSEWIAAPYTTDGETVYAIVHNEYRGDTHGATRPDQCPSGERFPCLDTSVTMVVSTDGGDTYDHIAPPPDHMIATLPYVFNDEGVPSGLRQPSNIIQGPDGFFYVFTNISDYPAEEQWVCAMRTDDLGDPKAWRFWTGSDFTGVFVDPYRTTVGPDGEKCAPLARPQLSASVQESVIYDEALGAFVMFGTAPIPVGADPQWGVYYSLSDDLVQWSTRRLLLELPSYPSVEDPETDSFYAYVSVIDPNSPSPSFETSDGDAYLYITRFNEGTSSLDRDLVRFPIRSALVAAEKPDWSFDTDGDTEGWAALNGLSPLDTTDGNLVMESTAADPYFTSAAVEIPAAFDRLVVRMRVSSGAPQLGQLFFATTTGPDYTEDASKVFEVIADGEFHEYILDMSEVAAWAGTIIALRLDPVADAGFTIEIDRIWFR